MKELILILLVVALIIVLFLMAWLTPAHVNKGCAPTKLWMETNANSEHIAMHTVETYTVNDQTLLDENSIGVQF